MNRRHAFRYIAGACAVAGALRASALAQPAFAPLPPIMFPKESVAMSWKTECIGRVLIDMPTDRARSWSAQVDVATIRRLQRPLSLSQFWSGVETVRDQYVKQRHREHSSRLAHFERSDARRGAFVIGYESPNSFYAPTLWRFVHLDDQHAYEFRTDGLDTDNVAPTPGLFKPFVDQYSPIFSRLKPLKDGEIPSGEGLCIDGALVSGETGRNAKAGLNVEIASGTLLGLGYLENNHQAALESVFEELNRDKARADFALTLHREALGYKEFKVLRRQERTLSGLRGQEFITRTTLNNGHVYYSMRWGLKGGAGLLEPTLSIHMDTPDTAKASNGSAYAPLPPEPELVRLWDSVLATFRLRPGALPAGQVLRAVN